VTPTTDPAGPGSAVASVGGGADLDLERDLGAIDRAAIRRWRLDRVRSVMDRFDLDGIAAFEYANGRYIADLRPLWAPNFVLRQAVLIGRGSDDTIVLVHQDDAPHRRGVMDWLAPERVREFPTAAFIESPPPGAVLPVVDAFTELGITFGRIGLDLTTVAALDNLRSAMPHVEWVDVAAAMNAARLVKSAGELEIMRLGSQVVDLALERAITAAVPGTRECEVLAEAMAVFYRHGAEIPQCNLIVCSGPNTAPMQRYAGYRRIEPGDLVFIDIGACFGGMFSEATRTVAVGRPSDEQRRIYQLVHAVHLAVIDAMRPGATAEILQSAAADVLARSPLAERMQKMVIGHGIGVGYAEAPFIRPPGTPTPPLTLEAGMTIAIVPTIIVPDVAGGGGIRLEDVVAVTPDGHDVLTTHPYADGML
jgi:Xaa-Pro aminopeptidase